MSLMERLGHIPVNELGLPDAMLEELRQAGVSVDGDYAEMVYSFWGRVSLETIRQFGERIKAFCAERFSDQG